MAEIKIKKVSDSFILPSKASNGSSAYDVYVPKTVRLKYGRQIIKTGFCIEIPDGYALDMRCRSGLSVKGLLVYDDNGYEHRINADVTLGLIDSDYRGEVGIIVDVKDWRVLFDWLLGKTYSVMFGQAVAQMKFCEIPETKLVVTTDELSKTLRGERGFGKLNNE